MAPPRLSPNFSFIELTTTQVRGADNTPGHAELANLIRLSHVVLEPVRRTFGPFYVSSGYRSPEVNAAIGGSATSAHMDGRAADGAPIARVAWRNVIRWVLENEDVPIDQVIYEFGRWVHFGIAKEGEKPRRQALMIFDAGRYEAWNPKDPRITR